MAREQIKNDLLAGASMLNAWSLARKSRNDTDVLAAAN